MPKRRLKHLEESYGGASGEYPEYGAIFMSNNFTRKECLRLELFGLPIRQAGFVKQVKTGMMLFLFEFESRELHGVFQACSDGAINIEPDAYRSSGKQFPAQVLGFTFMLFVLEFFVFTKFVSNIIFAVIPFS